MRSIGGWGLILVSGIAVAAVLASVQRRVRVERHVLRVDGFDVEASDQVFAFVDAFDDGLYPDLDVDA